MEDYWLGHRINHGSGDKVNVVLIEGYLIKTCKEIKIGEELFLDYNRSLYWGKCHQEEDFFLQKLKKQEKCMECHKFVFYWKTLMLM
jgi:hypothetical protein